MEALEQEAFKQPRLWQAKKAIMLRTIEKALEAAVEGRYIKAMILMEVLRGQVRLLLIEPWREDIHTNIDLVTHLLKCLVFMTCRSIE